MYVEIGTPALINKVNKNIFFFLIINKLVEPIGFIFY